MTESVKTKTLVIKRGALDIRLTVKPLATTTQHFKLMKIKQRSI